MPRPPKGRLTMTNGLLNVNVNATQMDAQQQKKGQNGREEVEVRR
jgi:hypothetical protein